MPFFPTGSKVSRSRLSRSRGHSPTPIKTTKEVSNHQYSTSKFDSKKKLKPDFIPNDQYYGECDSQADTENTYVDIKAYLVDSHTGSKMGPSRTPQAQPPGDIERNEYPRPRDRDRPSRPEPLRTQARQSGRVDQPEVPNFDIDDVTNRLDNTFLNDTPPFPVAPIYEQIHILRQHGASVKFGPSSRANCLHDLIPRQSHTPRGSFSPISSPNMLNPTRDEINAVDHALASVINTGGEVEFQPLDHVQSGSQLKCDACFESFALQQDRDEHIKGGRIKCSQCAVCMPCQTLLEEHVYKAHAEARNTGSYSSAGRHSFGSPRNESQQWGKEGGR